MGERLRTRMVVGTNFSGRTDSLRRWVGLPNEPAGPVVSNGTAFVGPDAGAALSGVAPTVEAEIELMAADRPAAGRARAALASLGFEHLLPQNPFTLSGGEQVVLAVLAAVAGRPTRLALDCALEQLSPATRQQLMCFVEAMDCELMLVDNRWREWYAGPTEPPDRVVPIRPPTRVEAAPPAPIHDPSSSLEIVDLHFAYDRSRPLFRNLNLRIDAGRRYLLKGPNGSGKSTLSKILCGLLKPTGGEIRIGGKPIEPWRTPGRFVGYHFQHPDFQLFGRTVAEQFGGPASRWAPYCAALDCDVAAAAHPLDLSFAMRKRVAIATTLARERAATILDEPTLCQDDGFVGKLRARLMGTMSIVVSHSALFDDYDILQLG